MNEENVFTFDNCNNLENFMPSQQVWHRKIRTTWPCRFTNLNRLNSQRQRIKCGYWRTGVRESESGEIDQVQVSQGVSFLNAIYCYHGDKANNSVYGINIVYILCERNRFLNVLFTKKNAS